MSRTIRTKARLLAAAERLFALRGIEGVSLREIAVEAGVFNNAAVQYHFGTKENLIEALFLDRMMQMEPLRGRLLDEHQKRGKADDLRSLLEIICRPHLELADDHGNHSYAQFLAQYLLRYRPPMGYLAMRPEPPAPQNLTTAQSLVRHALDGLPETVIVRRLLIAVLAYLTTLVNYHSFASTTEPAETLDQALSDTLDQMAIVMGAPWQGDNERT